jgi:hypothetical protein
MPPLSYRAIAIAFAAELVADFTISLFVFGYFARDLLVPDMSQEQFEQVTRTVMDTTAYLPWSMVFGTATTVGGGYLAARLAGRIPYYHGLAMGVAGLLLLFITWSNEYLGFNLIALLTTVPAALYGAHLAKKHMSVEP